MRTFEKFTDQARRVVELAEQEAIVLGQRCIHTGHLLLSLIHDEEGIAVKALESLKINLVAVRQQISASIGHCQDVPEHVAYIPGAEEPLQLSLPFSPRAMVALEQSWEEAQRLHHKEVCPWHILLGLIREGQGVVAQTLVRLGVDLGRAEAAVRSLLWQWVTQLVDENALPVVRQYMYGNSEQDDVVQEIRVRLYTSCHLIPEEAARRSAYIRRVAQSRIADHFNLKTRHGFSLLTTPERIPEEGHDDSPPRPYTGEDDAGPLIEKCNRRLSSLFAEAETCPVDQHGRRGSCPQAVLQTVMHALALATPRLTQSEGDRPARGCVFDAPRNDLREQEVRFRIAGNSSPGAASRWVERTVLPCFDWWVYQAIDGLDKFDPANYEQNHSRGAPWPNPLPHEWAHAREYVNAVKVHRWMVLRHIKIDGGKWNSEKYGVKRMRTLLDVNRDLEVIISIHMPDAARALGLKERAR